MKKSLVAGLVAFALILAGATQAQEADAQTTAAGSPVTGIVTLDGAPVAGTEVGWIDPTSGVSGATVTDAAGDYALTVTAGHPYVLYAGVRHTKTDRWRAVDLKSYVPVFAGASGTDYMFQSLSPFPATAGIPTTSNFSLPRPATITGTEPAFAKMRVDVFSVSGQDMGWADADADGTFAITGLIPGRYRLTALDLPGFEPYLSAPVTVAAGTTTTIHPELSRGASLTGIVRVKGKPAKGVPVYAYNGKSGGGSKTDRHGRYTITGLVGGRYRLGFNEGYYTGLLSQSKWTTKITHVTVPRNGSKNRSANLARGGKITATVVLPKGTQGVNVMLLDKQKLVALSGAWKKGKATFEHIKAGTYTAIFVAPAGTVYAKRTVTVRDGGTVALGRVSLDSPTTSLTVKLKGAKSAEVVFIAPTSNTEDSYGTTRHGTFTIKGIVPGYRGTLRVYAAHHDAHNYAIAPTRSTTMVVKPGTRQGELVGTISLNGLSVWAGSGYIHQKHREGGLFSNHNGTITDGWASAGKAMIDFNTTVPFVERAPFWVRVPAAQRRVTFTSGKKTNVGELKLEVAR